MSRSPITGRTVVAGVAGWPVAHSLSPIIHNAWLAAAGIDGVYVPFGVPEERFEHFVDGLRGGVVRGLNVTLPFKERALALADRKSDLADAVGAANVLIFEPDGTIFADNTDGAGVLGALKAQAPNLDLATSQFLILGAGGAARGAIAALIAAGVPQVQILNRTYSKALALAEEMGHGVEAVQDVDTAFAANTAVINATSTIHSGAEETFPLRLSPPGAVIMHMSYKPLKPPLLVDAEERDMTTVDGLEMLIAQAAPSFEAFYGQAPPPGVDVRALALEALGQ